MPYFIDDAKFREVARLLEEGELSYVAIAARAHVSRGTVVRVCRRAILTSEEEREGKALELLREGSWSVEVIARRVGLEMERVRALASEVGVRTHRSGQRRAAEDVPRDGGEPRRCPTCGGLVYMPCYLCYVRDLKRRRA